VHLHCANVNCMKYLRGDAQMASDLFANLLESGNRHAGWCVLLLVLQPRHCVCNVVWTAALGLSPYAIGQAVAAGLIARNQAALLSWGLAVLGLGVVSAVSAMLVGRRDGDSSPGFLARLLGCRPLASTRRRPARGGRADGRGGPVGDRPRPRDENRTPGLEAEDYVSESRHSDADRLERRARWLLRAYPAAYRADRGEEITGTLLEATPPGRDWPPPRETASLIAAGLRARRAANLRQGLAASLRQTAVVGAAVYLVQLPAMGLAAVVWAARRGHLPYLFEFDEWLFYVLAGLALVLLAAAWSGRRKLVAAIAVAAVIAAVSFTVIRQQWDLMVVLADFVGPPAVVFLAFARRAQRPPASLLWLPGLALGAAAAASFAGSYPALFAATTARTTLLSPYVTVFSLVTLLWPSAGWQPTSARWPASSLPSRRAGLSTVSPMAALWLRSRRP